MSASPRTERPVIICHDGSSEAIAAVEYAGALLPRARAVIVTLWRPLAEESLAPAGRPPASDPAESEDALVLHVSRPVLVVPSVKAATERRREAEERLRVHRPLAAQPR